MPLPTRTSAPFWNWNSGAERSTVTSACPHRSIKSCCGRTLRAVTSISTYGIASPIPKSSAPLANPLHKGDRIIFPDGTRRVRVKKSTWHWAGLPAPLSGSQGDADKAREVEALVHPESVVEAVGGVGDHQIGTLLFGVGFARVHKRLLGIGFGRAVDLDQ